MTIKELREKYHLSQSALAKSIGVSSSAISNMESGRMKASAKIADAVKNVYGEVIDVGEEKAENAKEKAVIAAIETKAIADEVKVEATEKAMEIASSVKEKKAKVGKKVINYAEVAMKKLMTQMRGFVVQSPLGGEITPDMIYEKVGDVDRVYIRVDQNKAYWVKGEETGSIDLW